MLDLTKTYRTKGGLRVRNLRVLECDPGHVHGEICKGGEWVGARWQDVQMGFFLPSGFGQSELDLVGNLDPKDEPSRPTKTYLAKDGREAFHYNDVPTPEMKEKHCKPTWRRCLPGYRWLLVGEQPIEGDWVACYPFGSETAILTFEEVDHNSMSLVVDEHRFVRPLAPIDLSTCTFGQRLLMEDGTQGVFCYPWIGDEEYLVVIEGNRKQVGYLRDGTPNDKPLSMPRVPSVVEIR
jgi:hypothetical protein